VPDWPGGRRESGYAYKSPTIVFVAEKDHWTPPAECIKSTNPRVVTDAKFEVISYPNAHLDFDQSHMTTKYKGQTLAWEEADRARRFIATIEASNSTDIVSRGGLSHEEWLTWAKKRLMAYDPLETGIESVWDNLASVTSWEYRD
jgi:hypothetical protein